MATLKGIVLCMIAAVIGFASPPAGAEPKQTKADKPLEETLYNGIRATSILESRVFSKNGGYLGQVRNIVLADDGSVKAIIAEQAGIGIRPEFVFRIPWDSVVQPARPGALIADLSDTRSDQFGLFAQEPEEGAEFLVSEVLGDYARLQTGLGYGYVKDIVLAPPGQMVAVLIARDARTSVGTVAFPYPGRTGRWSPKMSYYGLPFVTLEQADAAAMKVNAKRFETDG
ncbi:MAG: PRC-barrel domain-containing protein [Nitrobacter sp.]|uniref:PRC-barrel domain-containing protein n=1 Tax=Nitrobacter sp. TaxID=29420 RepID=UPI002626858E|nr:PRC-barrel domain-containing protein [Nitrobacter sp.]MCV0387859.1 PRC-barrel domain-containing protein [Nitrobacter sp.]